MGTVFERVEDRSEGWSPVTIQHYLNCGRDWQAVDDFFRRITNVSADLSQIAISSACPASAAKCTPLVDPTAQRQADVSTAVSSTSPATHPPSKALFSAQPQPQPQPQISTASPVPSEVPHAQKSSAGLRRPNSKCAGAESDCDMRQGDDSGGGISNLAGADSDSDRRRRDDCVCGIFKCAGADSDCDMRQLHDSGSGMVWEMPSLRDELCSSSGRPLDDCHAETGSRETGGTFLRGINAEDLAAGPLQPVLDDSAVDASGLFPGVSSLERQSSPAGMHVRPIPESSAHTVGCREGDYAPADVKKHEPQEVAEGIQRDTNNTENTEDIARLCKALDGLHRGPSVCSRTGAGNGQMPAAVSVEGDPGEDSERRRLVGHGTTSDRDEIGTIQAIGSTVSKGLEAGNGTSSDGDEIGTIQAIGSTVSGGMEAGNGTSSDGDEIGTIQGIGSTVSGGMEAGNGTSSDGDEIGTIQAIGSAVKGREAGNGRSDDSNKFGNFRDSGSAPSTGREAGKRGQPAPAGGSEAGKGRSGDSNKFGNFQEADSAASKGREAGKTGQPAAAKGGEAGKRGQSAAAKGREAGKRGQPAGPITWRVLLAYHGPSVGPWAWHPDQPNAVQGLLQRAIAPLCPKRTVAGRHVDVPSAGRTDRGVSAAGQVISFKTEEGPPPQRVLALINAAAPGLVTAYRAERVPRSFHATWGARWRRYAYLLPLRREGDVPDGGFPPLPIPERAKQWEPMHIQKAFEAPDVQPHIVNELLGALVGRAMDFSAYARDIPAGKDCTCTLTAAGARPVVLGTTPAMCIEVCGDRFLRHMVRVLVATAVREAISGAGHAQEAGKMALIALAETQDRMATAPPAPALGLCFLTAGY